LLNTSSIRSIIFRFPRLLSSAAGKSGPESRIE
jgi:hypothetical protein